ncbi:MASE1 domain-containing protein [Streptomyces sp. DH24]|uniref:MASE1 domain-containing protein n=1 Tax=Streptomyces sp. DH24 TaxID=3040123 RepID=UPI0024415840|nr:MASE1 domain-containing protein [Streptomyces sp. DH24]MDG9719443.1 MASE1 domain-containing protein [Streptomyces sp. DH24]
MTAVAGIRAWPRPVVLALETLAVSASYYATGRLGLLRQLSVEDAVVTPVWPPTGLAVACLLVLGLRAVPGIVLGALFVIMSITSITSLTPGVVVTLFGNTAGPVCALFLLRRADFRTDLSRLRDGLALVFLAALASMLISASIGVGALIHAGKLDTDSFWPVWLAWWVGDAMGVVIVTPLLLLLTRVRWPPARPRRWVQAVALTVITGALVWLATHSPVSLLYLVFPLLVWGALSFEHAGSMLCALFASVMASIAATDRAGPFRGLTDVEVMMKLQAFNGSMALTALLLSAVITEQRNTRRSVERACQELVEVLEHLTGTTPPRSAHERLPDEDGQRR